MAECSHQPRYLLRSVSQCSQHSIGCSVCPDVTAVTSQKHQIQTLDTDCAPLAFNQRSTGHVNNDSDEAEMLPGQKCRQPV